MAKTTNQILITRTELEETLSCMKYFKCELVELIQENGYHKPIIGRFDVKNIGEDNLRTVSVEIQ